MVPSSRRLLWYHPFCYIEEVCMDRYFKQMDSLELDIDNIVKATENDTSSYFMPAGDLEPDLEDLAQIKEVYNYAYNHMRDEGNINQWSDYISFEKGVINYINSDCFYIFL